LKYKTKKGVSSKESAIPKKEVGMTYKEEAMPCIVGGLLRKEERISETGRYSEEYEPENPFYSIQTACVDQARSWMSS
jgi:hypothetical protein